MGSRSKAKDSRLATTPGRRWSHRRRPRVPHMTVKRIAELPKLDTPEKRKKRARRRRQRRLTPAQLRLARKIERALRREFAKFFVEVGHAANLAASPS